MISSLFSGPRDHMILPDDVSVTLSLSLSVFSSLCVSVSLDQSILGGELGLGSPGATSPTKPSGQYYQHYGSNPRRRALHMDPMGETQCVCDIITVAAFSVTMKRAEEGNC